ncbi:MAG TPA: hypothetical protein VEL71_03580 [Candidatus Dormibacteraeota bacterium]|nr:hypothetical protein [Candidatus Dormibacteraeota bacterium]
MMNERLRWLAVGLLLVVGVIDLYYGNSFAGFYENLWYVMGGVYIFAAIVIAANIEPRFSQLTVFAYTLFLWSVWATVAVETGTGLDVVAYADKAVEVVLAVNLALLFRSSRVYAVV